MSSGRDDVLLVASLGGGNNVAGVADLVDGLNVDISNDVAGGEGGEDFCAVESGDGAGGDVWSCITTRASQGSSSDSPVCVVVDDGTGRTSRASKRDLEAKLAGSTLDQDNLASNGGGEVGLSSSQYQISKPCQKA